MGGGVPWDAGSSAKLPLCTSSLKAQAVAEAGPSEILAPGAVASFLARVGPALGVEENQDKLEDSLEFTTLTAAQAGNMSKRLSQVKA